MDTKRFIKLYGKNFVKDIINESPPSSTLIYYDDIESKVWYYKDNGYQAYNSIFKSWSFIFDPQEPLPLSTKDHLVDLCELKRIIT